MIERTLPISKKQHDGIAARVEAIRTAPIELKGMVQGIIDGADDDLGSTVHFNGVRAENGVYTLVLLTAPAQGDSQ